MANPTARPFRLVVRVWLPDRPGALGLVASRIGALGADIIGIDVLERTPDAVIDEFAVALHSEELVGLLIREIEEVDGVVVDEWQQVDHFPDPRLDALDSADGICTAETPEALYAVLTQSVRAEFGADWAALWSAGSVIAVAGDTVPDAATLAAFARNIVGWPDDETEVAGPGDLAGAPLPANDALLLVGRGGHPLRRRERKQLSAIARIADRVASLLEAATESVTPHS